MRSELLRKHLPAGILALALLGGVFGAGTLVGERRLGAEPSLMPAAAATSSEEVDLSQFWEVWNLLDRRFVPATPSSTPATAEEKLWAATQGLAGAYNDPYTVFLPPEETELFESDIQGEFQGVGMEIGIRDNTITVISPLKGTPADRAGVRSGDRILKIDDVGTEGMLVEQAVKRIRGPKGTSVVLLIARDGDGENVTKTIEIVRDTILVPVLETELRGDGVFVIKLYSFTATAPALFRGALREFIEAGTDKLLIDLRANPGGYLEASVDMASFFLPAGKPVVIEELGGGKDDIVHRSYGYDVFNENLKMAILVNEGSASASEIFAGALQEYGKAKLIGTQTFGKGSVQELIDLTGGASLKVTIARWLTPHGRSISAGGLTPDFIVERTARDIEAGRDPQVDGAVQFLTTGYLNL